MNTLMRWTAVALVLLSASCADGDETQPGSPPPVDDRDRDRDGVPVSEDCAPDDAGRYRTLSRYQDADGDGVGAGEPGDYCAGANVPAGLVEKGGDCAPDDAEAWQMHAYASHDGDGDGRGTHAPGELCAGSVLPSDYVLVELEPDCNDADASVWWLQAGYLDEDGDGRGAGDELALCTNGSLGPGHAEIAGDCAPGDAAAWQIAGYGYRDSDGDGATVREAGSLCIGDALPPGYSSTGSGNDCNDVDPAQWQHLAGYADEDGDGAGAGALQVVCAGEALPDGMVAAGTDCAPGDPARWRLLGYQFRDADGDGHTVASSGSVCSGVSLPPGHANTGAGADCDDADPAGFIGSVVHADADGDGVGAGPAQSVCNDGSLPAGFSRAGGDCGPADAEVWRLLAYSHVDADGDGATTPLAGNVCAGLALPDPYRTEPSGNDCDDEDPALRFWVLFYPDGDGDGVGTLPRIIDCLAENAIPAGFSHLGHDPDDTDPNVTRDDTEIERLLAFD
jgi:hypothetical protein